MLRVEKHGFYRFLSRGLRRTLVAAMVLGAVLATAACSQVSERIRPATFVPVSTEPKAQAREYIAMADRALADDQLSRPWRNSAVQLYRKALKLDPNNRRALKGLALADRRFVGLANAALSRGNVERAYTLLDRAIELNPENQPARALRQSLVQQEQWLLALGKASVMELDARALSERQEALAKNLQKLAVELASSGERIVIYTRTDAEARWVYQQLKRAKPEVFFSASTGLSATPRIIRVPGSA
ncbi:hypothetical protein L1F30_15705 [Simiduia sp. 21SJ11W-1]|uniref:tetratricopeptide repeat protein n=1 Tax=Simiduia sp. 21SJ11W-1 TaxID=2909669 RepID=UPI0020A22AB5|nr:tetratricopeptide repeat protein [Simiduia sp. 21SJ11W-1]UTA47587.1 hypothetical protein L1F30_15705 [Simiduia sp. 21SJ11W-1]